MSLFNQNDKKKEVIIEKQDLPIEIVAHHNSSAKVVREAKQASNQINSLLEENGFTLKIYLARGGRTPASGRKI